MKNSKKIESKIVSIKYILQADDVKIGVEKDCSTNNITVYRHNYFNQPLVFKESTKEMCEAIGKLNYSLRHQNYDHHTIN